MRDRAAEDVADVADPLEVHQAFGVRRLRRLEVSRAPGGQPGQGGGGAARQVVVVEREVQRPLREGDGAVDVSCHQRQAGAVDRDLGRQPAEPLVVHDDHSVRGIVQPALGVLQQRLDALHGAGGQARAGQGVAEHRPDPEHLVGEHLQPAPQRRLAPVPAHGRHLQLHQGGRAPRSPRRPWRAGSPRPGRRSIRTSRWPAGAAPAPGRAARRAAAPAARRRTGGGSGTTAGGRRAGPGTGSAVEVLQHGPARRPAR